jgi:hypothetical protein
VVREAYTLNNNMVYYRAAVRTAHIATLPPRRGGAQRILEDYFIGSSPDKGEYAAFLLDQATPKSASFVIIK